MNPILYFVIEAGKKVGMGHYNRSKALYLESIKFGVRAEILLISDVNSSLEANKQYRNYYELLVDKYLKNDSVIIVDGYNLDVGITNSLFKVTDNIVIIDDYFRVLHKNVIVINPSLIDNSFKYSNKEVLSGPQYIILRDAFLHPLPANNPKKDYVLIYLGGAFSVELIDLLITSFKSSGITSNIRIITLDRYIEYNIPSRYNDVLFLNNLSETEMYNEIRYSKFGIIAAGQILYEFIKMEKAFFPIITADNQLENLNSLLVILPNLLYTSKDLAKDDLVYKLKQMNDFYMSKMVSKFNNLIEGNGQFRIMEYLKRKFVE